MWREMGNSPSLSFEKRKFEFFYFSYLILFSVVIRLFLVDGKRVLTLWAFFRFSSKSAKHAVLSTARSTSRWHSFIVMRCRIPDKYSWIIASDDNVGKIYIRSLGVVLVCLSVRTTYVRLCMFSSFIKLALRFRHSQYRFEWKFSVYEFNWNYFHFNFRFLSRSALTYPLVHRWHTRTI